MSTFNAQLRKRSRAGYSTLNIQQTSSLEVGRRAACSRTLSELNALLANTFGVGRFSKRLFVVGVASSIAISYLGRPTPAAADQPHDLTVLILGDSLGLCGFSKRLDQKFRADPRVKSVFTYCTCGTNPLSWLKEKPFTHIQTHCGYWSIES